MLVLAVFFGFVDWGVGTATVLLEYVGWGEPGDLNVDSYNVDPAASPKFEVTAEYVNEEDKPRDIWLEISGNTPAGSSYLGRVPTEADGPLPIGPEDASGQLTFEYNGDLRNLGCGFTIDVHRDCVGIVAPMIGCTGVLQEVSDSQRMMSKSVRLEGSEVPPEWQGKCS